MSSSSRSILAAACVLLALASTGRAEERPHVRVFVEPADKAQYSELIGRSDLDVAHVHDGRFDILATPAQVADLEARGFPVRVVTENVYEPAGPTGRGGTFLPEYTSYSEMTAQLNAFVAAHPTRAALSTIGQSLEGRDIYALKISDNVATDETEPEVLIIGNHHAREVITVTIPLAIADSLLNSSNPVYQGYADDLEIFLVPCLNPDGYVYVETSDLFWRKNRRDNAGPSFGVDLNRNWAYEWGHDDNGSDPSPSDPTYRGTAPESEPEIQVIRAFVDSRDFVMSQSFHSYGNLELWGPGWKPAYSENEDVFAGFGTEVAAHNGYSIGGPAAGNIYITNGSSDDWLYNVAGIWAFTPEVGSSFDYFNPPANRIPTLVVEGSHCAWEMFEAADRPEKLAPPGQPALDALPPSADGNYDVTWSGPTTADTQVALYELTEKAGPAVVTDDLESGTGAFELGGWSASSARASSGTFSLYSGNGNDLSRICLAREGYVVQPGDMFTFDAWYDIEEDWDYAYVILSTDGGRSHVNLAGTGTTMNDPHGNNADNGITGNSGGWNPHAYDLSAWVGQEVWLGFRYYTDQGVVDPGIWIDDIHPVQTWATSTVLSSTIPGTSYAVAGQGDGTYWYTVRGQDAEGDWGYPSAAGSVTVDPVTDVEVVASAPGFSLESAAPNPFRGATSIRFSLRAPGSHALVVYDVSGRRVRTLSDGPAPAGPRQVSWDGRNDRGRAVPSGVYFYRLTSEAGELRNRVILQR